MDSGRSIVRFKLTTYDHQDTAQSLPIDPLGPGAAEVLAGNVEYRLHLICQEAKKFMVHGKRAVMLPQDVEYAMEALNVEVGVEQVLVSFWLFSSYPGLLSGTKTTLRHRCIVSADKVWANVFTP